MTGDEKRELKHEDRIIFGRRLAFRFNEAFSREQQRLKDASLDWKYAQDELHNKLEAMQADLEKERENVRVLKSLDKDKDGEMQAIRHQLDVRNMQLEGERR